MRKLKDGFLSAVLASGLIAAATVIATPAMAQSSSGKPAAQGLEPPPALQDAPNAPQAVQPPSGTVKSKHGAWSIICDTPPGASSEQCAMMQNVVAEDRPEVGLSVVVLKTADHKAQILRVLAPLGVLLPNGLGLKVDGKDIGRAYFVRCFQDGCYAEVILEKQLLDTLSHGKSATFIVFQTPEQGIGIPVDLKGFAEGFAALP